MKLLFCYGIVGLLGSISYFFGVIFFVNVMTLHPTAASILSYILIFTITFFINHHWVFASNEKIKKTIIRFGLVSLLGLTITTLIMFITVTIFNFQYLYGILLVLIIVPLSNFLLNSCWAFRNKIFQEENCN